MTTAIMLHPSKYLGVEMYLKEKLTEGKFTILRLCSNSTHHTNERTRSCSS